MSTLAELLVKIQSRFANDKYVDTLNTIISSDPAQQTEELLNYLPFVLAVPKPEPNVINLTRFLVEFLTSTPVMVFSKDEEKETNLLSIFLFHLSSFAQVSKDKVIRARSCQLIHDLLSAQGTQSIRSSDLIVEL